MSATLIQLFVFMSITFALGLFLGWALWRYGGVSKAAMESVEAQSQFWKKSFDQSRTELWKLQESLGITQSDAAAPSGMTSRRPVTRRPGKRISQPSIASKSALPGA